MRTEKYGLGPENIIVEITEQDIAEGTEQFKEALKQIRANGFRLWIDNFGSSYSSLNVLSQYTASPLFPWFHLSWHYACGVWGISRDLYAAFK